MFLHISCKENLYIFAVGFLQISRKVYLCINYLKEFSRFPGRKFLYKFPVGFADWKSLGNLNCIPCMTATCMLLPHPIIPCGFVTSTCIR